MRIIGHGIDMVDIESIKRDLEDPSKEWKRRVYSEQERLQSDTPPIDTRYFASRFAGKEAVAKALGTGFAGGITWDVIEILRDERGTPFVRLSGEAKVFADSLGITEWKISISYCGSFALASVIAWGS
jgi:holo-[acyl-carrier protein] synthase